MSRLRACEALFGTEMDGLALMAVSARWAYEPTLAALVCCPLQAANLQGKTRQNHTCSSTLCLCPSPV